MSGGYGAQAVSVGMTGMNSNQNGALIDLVHLSKYTLGDRRLEGELLSLFRSQAGVYLDRMASAKDTREWKEAAHSLKGSARGIGAWYVANHAEDAEQLMDAPSDRHEVVLEQVRLAVSETVVYIGDLLTD